MRCCNRSKSFEAINEVFLDTFCTLSEFNWRNDKSVSIPEKLAVYVNNDNRLDPCDLLKVDFTTAKGRSRQVSPLIFVLFQRKPHCCLMDWDEASSSHDV